MKSGTTSNMANVATLTVVVRTEDATKNLANVQAGLKKTGDEAERMGLKLRRVNTSIREVRDENGRLLRTITSTSTGFMRATQRFGLLEAAATRLKTALFAVGGVWALWRGAKGIGGIIDSTTLLRSRLSLVTNGLEEQERVWDRLIDIAADTRTELAPVAQLFIRMGFAQETLGASTDELLRSTETLTKMLAISGTNASEASAVLLQLGQAMQSGKFQGDELRTAFETLGSVLMGPLAQSLDTNVQNLRKLASEGKITGADLVDALVNASDEVDEKFGKLPVTISGALTVLSTRFLEMIDKLNTANTVGKPFADLILAIGNNIETILIPLNGWIMLLSTLIDKFNLLTGIRQPYIAEQMNDLREDRDHLVEMLNRGELGPPGFGVPMTDTDRADFLRQINEKNDELLRLQTIYDALNRPTTEPPGTSGGAPPGTGTGRDKIKEHIQDLAFEVDQLKRSAEQQAIYNELKQAGVSLDSTAGQEISRLVTEKLRLQEAQDDLNESTRLEQELFDEGKRLTESLKSATEVYADGVADLNRLLDIGAISADTYNKALDDLRDDMLRASTDLSSGVERSFRELADGLTDSASQIEDVIGSTYFALEDLLVDFLTGSGASIKDFLESLAEQLLRFFLQTQIFGPTFQGLASLFGPPGMALPDFTGVGGIGGGLGIPPAKPFGRGGVFDGPTIFPMARGMGLMGEAGPEAILPLKRDSGGNLGVVGQAAPVEIVINNSTGQPSSVRERQGPGGRQAVEIAIGQAVATDIKTRGPVSQSMESVFGLQRRGRN